jgi:2-oxoglutarate ferredoxin oxidoreductase subunit alpha
MFNGYKPNRGKLIKNTKDGEYLRYKVAKDGISERLIPGAKGFYYQANSYEHLENSHTTESDMERQVQADKRMKKMDQYFERDFALPKVYGDLDKAEIVFVSWGGMKGIVLEAQRLLKEEGKETAFVHFTHVYPLHEKKVNDMFDKFGSKKLVLVENNATGQFGQLLRMQTGINIEEKLLKYNGRPFFPVEIVSKIK